MIRTHDVAVKCPVCEAEIDTEVTVSGRREWEIDVAPSRCDECGYPYSEHDQAVLDTLARDAYDRLVYAFQRYGRDGG